MQVYISLNFIIKIGLGLFKPMKISPIISLILFNFFNNFILLKLIHYYLTFTVNSKLLFTNQEFITNINYWNFLFL
jgi:hypothetical protein